MSAEIFVGDVVRAARELDADATTTTAIGSLLMKAIACALSFSHGTSPSAHRPTAISTSQIQAAARNSAARTTIAGFRR